MKELLRNGKLVTLMLGHLTVDSYVGVIPVLYPVLIGRFHLSLATVGLVSLAYSGTAAISQPLFGVIADRYGTRFTGVALAWTALTFALVGFVPTFPLLVALACASGLGSGAFHPFGALDVRALLQAWRRSFGMSVYVTAGTIGVALGPLIGIGLLAFFGLHGTGLLVIPGVATGAYLLWRMRGQVRPSVAAAKSAAAAARPVPVFALAMVIGVMMSRSWTVSVFQAFTPTWYRQLGYGPEFYGPLATTLVLASAVGTVGCGSLGDRDRDLDRVPRGIDRAVDALDGSAAHGLSRRPGLGPRDGAGLRDRGHRRPHQRRHRRCGRTAEIADEPGDPGGRHARPRLAPAQGEADGDLLGYGDGSQAGDGRRDLRAVKPRTIAIARVA